ncbi:hypothetical protein HDU96_010492, partial [Phlyctochytrium bullatum]
MQIASLLLALAASATAIYAAPAPVDSEELSTHSKDDAAAIAYLASYPDSLPEPLARVVYNSTGVLQQTHSITLLAKGTQNYNCNATLTGGFAWVLREPVADLYVNVPNRRNSGSRLRKVGHH